MACFLVPTAEAIVTAIVSKSMDKEEKSSGKSNSGKLESTGKIPLSKKLHWLTRMLLGGSVLLAFEHIWHGEVVPWFPFLTAMADPEDAAEMFHEMSTVGVTMAVLITVVWIIMCLVADAIAKRPVPETAETSM